MGSDDDDDDDVHIGLTAPSVSEPKSMLGVVL